MNSSRYAPEDGNALVESLLLGLLLSVPLITILMVLAEAHAGALGITAAAREAGYEAARASDLAGAERAIDGAVERALSDHGLDPHRARVRWTSSRSLARGGLVTVIVQYRVPVFAAPFLGRAGPSITLVARHSAPIDPYRSRGSDDEAAQEL